MIGAGANVNFKAYNKHGELQQTFSVPASLVNERWFNLGIQRSPNSLITVFVNGYPYTEFTASSLFQMTGGALVLGRAHNNYETRYKREGLFNWVPTTTPANYGVFKGWMDDYKVFAYQPDLETVCNLAHGTLVTTGTNVEMARQAALYSSTMHSKVSTALSLRGKSVGASQYGAI